MSIAPLALKTECLNNPNGYTATVGGETKSLSQWFAEDAHSICADILNEPRAAISVPRSGVAPQEVLEAIDLTDMANISAINTAAGKILSETWLGSWFESIMQVASVQLRKWNAGGTALVDTRAMSNIKLLLNNGSASENRLRALAARPGSRAEQLAAPALDYVVTQADIAAAKAA